MTSKCLSCKNKNVKTSYGYTACNYSGSECRNFELYDPIKITNANRFRAMTDEELARTFADYISCHNCPIPYCEVRFTMERLRCQANWLDWLKQEQTI